MRKLFIAVLILGTSLSLMGFRGAGWRAARTVAGDWTFSESLDADSIDTDHLVVNVNSDINITSTTVDTALYIKKYGARTGAYGIVIDMDTSANTAGNVIGIDMSGSNAINNTSDHFLYLNSSYAWWRGDGLLKALALHSNSNLDFVSASNDGSIRCQYSKNFIFSWYAAQKGDVILRDGNHASGTINNDFWQIQDSSGTMQFALANKYIRGTATFDATKTADTLVMTGVTATDYYFLQWKGTTVPTSPLTYKAAVNSLIVFCAVGDTSVARAGGYNWLRTQ